MILVTLCCVLHKPDLDVQQTRLKTIMNLVTPKAGAKHEILFNNCCNNSTYRTG
jgi:hypothetical protein